MKFNYGIICVCLVMACSNPDEKQVINEALVYTKNKKGNLDLYKSDVLGQWEERLTTNPAMDWSPQWMPEKKELTYYMYDNFGRFSWVSKTMRSQVVDTLPFSDLLNARLSPDGAYVYYSSEEGEGMQIKRRRIDGSEDELLMNEGYNNGRFSLDQQHKQMAFISDSTGTNQLFVMDLSTREIRQITSLPYVAKYHSFSPNGTQIAVCLAEPSQDPKWDIFIYDLQTESLQRLTNTPYSEQEIAWSLSGEKIAFHGASQADGDQIYTIDLADGKFTKITSGDFYHGEPVWVDGN